MMNQSLISFVLGVVSVGCLALLSFYQKRKAKKTTFNKLTLYKFSQFRSNRCIWLIAELGIKDEVSFIDFDSTKKDSKDMVQYKAGIHPHGTVPALVINQDTVLIESGAICLYLAELCGKLIPPDRANYYNWVLYCCSTVDEILETLFIQWMHVPVEDQDTALIEEAKHKFKIFADHLEKTMASRLYICGDKLCAADCVLGYNLWWASVMKDGILLRGYPNIEAYYSRLRGRPAFKETFNL